MTSLRTKTAFALLVVVGLCVGINLAILRFSITPSFAALERREAEQDMKRCLRALDSERQHLQGLTHDWAAWDDTYAFVQDENEAYLEANLCFSSFTDNSLVLLCILDSEGELVWGGAADLEEEEPIPLETFLTVPFEGQLDPASPNAIPEARSGLFMTPGGPLLVAIYPILTSANEGPSRGTFIMGRLVGDDFIADLRAQTEVDFTIVRLDADDSMAQAAGVSGSQGIQEDARFVGKDVHHLFLEADVDDIFGRPALRLCASIPREITREGQAASWFAFFSTLSAGLVVLVIAWVLIGRIVVSPLTALTRHMLAIKTSGDLSARLEASREDEIGILAREFDRLLARIESDFHASERTQAALRDSETRIRAIYEAALDGILTVTNGQDIDSVNPAALDLSGYTRGELVGQRMSLLIPELKAAAEEGRFSEVAEAMHSKSGGTHAEVEVRRRDGSTFPAYMSIANIPGDATGRHLIVLGDITELQAMREKLDRAERLAVIGEMGAAIAHEIRNPLTGIGSAIEVIGEAVPPGTVNAEVLGEVRAQVARVEHTVSALLMFAKPWAPEVRDCRVGTLLNEAWKDVCETESFQQVKFEVQGEADCRVVADRRLIVEQVLWNVLENAAHAMPHGGPIIATIETGSSFVRIAIKDAGPGVSEENRERIFVPFFTTKTRGTGLGLAVCRQIMDAHGGAIYLRPADDRNGTEMVLELPRGE